MLMLLNPPAQVLTFLHHNGTCSCARVSPQHSTELCSLHLWWLVSSGSGAGVNAFGCTGTLSCCGGKCSWPLGMRSPGCSLGACACSATYSFCCLALTWTGLVRPACMPYRCSHLEQEQCRLPTANEGHALALF